MGKAVAVRAENLNQVALVVRGGFGIVGKEELPFVIENIPDNAVDGSALHMHVKNGQENADNHGVGIVLCFDA